MKKLILLFFGLLLLLNAGPASAVPKLDMPTTSAVLEQPVYQGEIIEADIYISNKGDTDLVIESVSPG